jgi:hypothetical protein
MALPVGKMPVEAAVCFPLLPDAMTDLKRQQSFQIGSHTNVYTRAHTGKDTHAHTGIYICLGMMCGTKLTENFSHMCSVHPTNTACIGTDQRIKWSPIDGPG